MTTDKEHMDTTGAEANKPENQAAAEKQNTAPAGKPSEMPTEADMEVPKEEQPEVKPNLASAQESEETESITEAFAKANTDVEEANVPADTSAAEESNAVPASQSPGNAPAHEHHEEEEEEEDHIDYSQLSPEEIRQHLANVLKSADAFRKHRAINEMQREYELKFHAERQEALNKFKEEGGAEEDFDYHTSVEHQDLEKLLTTYRDSRHQQRQNQEEQRQRNLERKKELLNQLRLLVESAETKNSGDELKRLQNEWKTIGPVPSGETQELWDSYHALLDIFYNNRSMFFEMKELDRRRNLEAKLQLVDRAQALQEEPSINKALQELRHLHEEWKNIGPVPNDQRDPIWEQFTQASEKVHERRRAYHEERSTRELQNLTVKKGLLERLQEFAGFDTDRINEWRDKTDEIQKLKDEWDKAGLVPKENAEEVNKAFWGNYKAFFQRKNHFFKALDEQKMHNLQLKTQLCEEAENLKDSTDWGSTKEKLIQLQKKWKTIGRVPDKHSDKIWQRFRSACNEFFDRKQENEQQRTAELEKLSAEKMEICDKVADMLSQPSTTGSVEEFHTFVAQWRGTDKGNQRPSPKAEDKFISLMEKYLERVPQLNLEQRSELLVKLQVERIKHSPDASHKLHQRENTLRREITQLQNDIQTLRTNIEFFARSKNADKLREEYEGRIADAQKRISQLQHQLKAFRG